MSSDCCVVCSRKVSSKQHALQCDSCTMWQHRVCNTGWHSRINKDIGRAHPSFYVLVPALKREANLVDLSLQLVTEEQILRDQRSLFRELQGHLHQYWSEYEDRHRTTSHLLCDCGKVYGPTND